MYYCCKCCKDCCNQCAKCIDDCCQSCCECCGDCCTECCKAIQQCFQAPFSFCTFMSFFVTCLPFILMIVAIIQSKNVDCKEPIKLHLVIQGICNLVNFLFCIYLMCQYSKGYTGVGKEGASEKNIFQRTLNLILYDFVVCFYIIALIFFIVWLILGHDWNSKEPQESECRKQNNGFLMTADLINLITMDIFLVVGGIAFLFTIIVIACDEGSCECDSLISCLCLCLTCGCCDPYEEKRKQKFREQNKMEEARQNRQQYQPNRAGWVDKSKQFLLGFGFFNSSSQKKYEQQELAPQQNYQQQQQQQYNYQQQQQQQQPQIINQPYQQQQYQQQPNYYNQQQQQQQYNNYQQQGVYNMNQNQMQPVQNQAVIQYNPGNQGAQFSQQQNYNYPMQSQPPQQNQQVQQQDKGFMDQAKDKFNNFFKKK